MRRDDQQEEPWKSNTRSYGKNKKNHMNSKRNQKNKKEKRCVSIIGLVPV